MHGKPSSMAGMRGAARGGSKNCRPRSPGCDEGCPPVLIAESSAFRAMAMARYPMALARSRNEMPLPAIFK
jgi:hypothetical protein